MRGMGTVYCARTFNIGVKEKKMEEFTDTRHERICKQTGVANTKVFAICALLLALLWPNQFANAQQSQAPPTQPHSVAVDWPNTGLLGLPTSSLADTGYSAGAYLKAAIELQTVGKDKACAALMARAKTERFVPDNMEDRKSVV